MARLNMYSKADRNVARLSRMWNVPKPDCREGCPGYGNAGLYSAEYTATAYTAAHPKGHQVRVGAFILLASSSTWATIVETTAHEFAHHLMHVWGIDARNKSGEKDCHAAIFWAVLAEVRASILPGNRFRELAHNAVEHIDPSWK